MILLVEDNPDDADLTLRAFDKVKIAPVEVARDGVEALARLRDVSRPLPLLVLLDLNLPRVSGLEVLKAMRSDERIRLIPTVILTSSKEESDIVASYENGANSYVRKPVDFGELVEATRALGSYWLGLNETPSK